MVDFNKIKKLDDLIQKNKEKLKTETNFQKKEVLKLKISINQMKIRIEKLN